MSEQTNMSKGKKIANTVFWLLFLAVYLAAMIWMVRTNRRLYFAGCIWRINDFNQVVLAVIWLYELIRRIRNIRKTEDPELKKERIRSCRNYGIFVGIMTVLVIAVIVMTFAEQRNTHYAELPAESNRSILLEEGEYGGRIYVYQKKGVFIRPEDELRFMIYANQHIVANEQYTWETDGKTVTVRFETGGLDDGLEWDETSGEPEPPAFIEKQFALPE